MSPATDQQANRGPASDESAADAAGGPERREVAVALKHERAGDELPKVIASGEGAVARQILEIAFARGIKVREDADLAEILAAIDVDSEIPLTALAAVAEILSYVYRASAEDTGDNGPAEESSAPR